jgi:hypothetical protein
MLKSKTLLSLILIVSVGQLILYTALASGSESYRSIKNQLFWGSLQDR